MFNAVRHILTYHLDHNSNYWRHYSLYLKVESERLVVDWMTTAIRDRQIVPLMFFIKIGVNVYHIVQGLTITHCDLAAIFHITDLFQGKTLTVLVFVWVLGKKNVITLDGMHIAVS